MALRHTLLAVPVFVCILSGCTTGLNDNNIVLVGSDEVHALLEKATKTGRLSSLALVDPRSPEEFAAAHLPGAINIEPIQHGGKPPRALQAARDVIVYGLDPGDALARGMTKRLMECGVSGVRLFAGGLRAWTLQHFQLEPPGANPFPEDSAAEAPSVLTPQPTARP